MPAPKTPAAAEDAAPGRPAAAARTRRTTPACRRGPSWPRAWARSPSSSRSGARWSRRSGIVNGVTPSDPFDRRPRPRRGAARVLRGADGAGRAQGHRPHRRDVPAADRRVADAVHRHVLVGGPRRRQPARRAARLRDGARRRSTSRSRTPPATAASTRSRTSSRPAAPRVIFVIPGRDTTLRVSGAARVTRRARAARPADAGRQAAAHGDRAATPRRSTRTARRRSCAPSCGIRTAGPTRPRCRRPAEVSVAHQRDPDWTVEQEEQRQAESLLHRLD